MFFWIVHLFETKLSADITGVQTSSVHYQEQGLILKTVVYDGIF